MKDIINIWNSIHREGVKGNEVGKDLDIKDSKNMGSAVDPVGAGTVPEHMLRLCGCKLQQLHLQQCRLPRLQTDSSREQHAQFRYSELPQPERRLLLHLKVPDRLPLLLHIPVLQLHLSRLQLLL